MLTVKARRADGQDAILPYGESELHIIIEDNGQGLAAQDTPNGKGGQGLALHSMMMAIIGGTLAVNSATGAYTRVVLAYPVRKGGKLGE